MDCLSECVATCLVLLIQQSGQTPVWSSLTTESHDSHQSGLQVGGEAGGLSCKVIKVSKDVLDAITRLRSDRLATEGLPPNIRSLKVQSLTSKVEEIRTELDEKGDSIKPSSNLYGVLFRSICHSGDDALIQLARGIESRLDKILLKDMERKYTTQTPIQHIADFEKRVLGRALHPRGENDPAVTPVLLRLYWLVQEENLDSSIQQFHDNRPAFRINPGYEKKLRYFLSGRGVPSRLQTKAQSFMRDLEAAGLVVRPPRR